MAELILFGIARKVIENILSAAVQEIGSIWGVTKELSALKETISTIKDVLLDAEEQKDHNHQVSSWLKKLEGVVYEADDLMDDVSTEALRRQLMSGSNMGKKVRTFFSCNNQLVFRTSMAHKIKDINDRLVAINKSRTDFYLEVRHEESRIVLRDREQTHSYIPEKEVIGRESDRKAILDLLLDPKVEEDVSVLPIVGLGGLGKTTLAQFVFNHEKVQTNFDLKMWVCVSENFDVKSLVEKIIKSATNHCEKNQEMDQLQRELRKEINGKRYFLVLDDVWNEDREKWLKLKNLLSNGAKGSRIMITTRSQVVGKITTSTMKPYMLGILDEHQSWSLFKNVAFRLGNEPNNPNTKATAMKIVDKCGGIPLAIRTIGSMLYSKPEAEWSSFLEMEFLRMPQSENNILSTLKLSYDNLPSHLKHCFAYCSLFPKDYEIEVDMLIKLWMAQGFVKSSSSGQSLEEAGFEIFNELHCRTFFQEVKKNDRTDRLECKMHDFMHDLAVQVSGTECLRLDSIGKNIAGRTRHVSFDFDLDPPSRLPNFLSKENRIRTILFLESAWDWDAILLGLKVLRTLDLTWFDLKKVPNSVGKLKHLRYLDLSWNDGIETLPNSITELLNLQTLKLSHCKDLVELPRDLKKLVNLRHLENDGCASLTHMPLGLGQLSNLVTLKEFVVNKEEVEPTNKRHNKGQVGVGGLNELMELKNLRGGLDIRNLRYGKNASEEYKDAKLKEKQHLHALTLKWSNRSNDNDDNVDTMSETTDFESTLESLQPHPNLKELYINDYWGVRLASWFSLLRTLDKLVLRGCKKIENASPLSQLPCLKSLTLESLSSLEFITNSDVTSVPLLSTLQRLELSSLPNLKGWWKDIGEEEEEEEEDIPPFECLSQLTISFCPQLTSNMPLYPYLEGELELTNNYRLKTFQRIQQMKIKMKLMDSFSPLSKLTSLCIIEIESLQSLVLTWSLTSLKKLNIEKCPKLKTLLPAFQQLTSLQELDISSCHEVDMYGDGGDGNMWLALQSLHDLKFNDLPQLETLPDGLQQLTSLQRLTLAKCESLVGIPQWIGNLKSLRRISVEECNKLTSLPEGMSQLNSLQYLHFFGLPELETLPDGLQQLTSLQELKLGECKSLVGIPEWIGNLKSLQYLDIFGSNKLTSLPEGMLQLTSLEYLHFVDLPQLETLPDGQQQLTSLKVLTLKHCESLVGIPEWIGNLRSLRHLYISWSNKITWLRQLTSLESLSITDLRQLETLPNCLQQLTSLEDLKLNDCTSLVGIPEWIGNLKSLRSLQIWGCNKLTSLPEGMRQLTSLRSLDIGDCNRILKQRCKRETGEDWHKVSHIEFLFINRERIRRPQQPSTSSSSAALGKFFKSLRRLQLCHK